MARRLIVGVMGGASVPESVVEDAKALGAGVAERGWVLLNGGQDAGVMRASAAGARAEEGLVVGVLPGRAADGGVAEDVEVAVFTGMGEARNVVNVRSSDAIVALRGGSGTLSEAALAARTDTPLVLVDWADVPAVIDDHGVSVATVEAALEHLDVLLA